MAEYLGNRGNIALFSNGNKAVLINTDLSMIVDEGPLVKFSNKEWAHSEFVSDNDIALADSTLDIVEDLDSLVASGRMYTIPDTVKNEAIKALKWRKEEKRGGTPVGLNTARILAKGGQIGLKKVRHIAKYFPRHEVDKKGKGWAPGEKNFPSNGRIAWALWGGDAAWRWASAIVEREDKKALTASSSYSVSGIQSNPVFEEQISNYDADIDAFKIAHELDPESGPEFLIRVRLDGSGIDRLYKIDIDGTVCVWDDCGWDDLGHVDGDVYTYDNSLDDPYDTVEKDHFVIDPGSAAIISGLFQENPDSPVSIDQIDALEAALAIDAYGDEDLELLDTIAAAANMFADATPDGEYPSELRSENAKRQARNAKGWWIETNDRVAVGNDQERGKGVITGIDENGRVSVKLDSGNEVTVDSKHIYPEGKSSTNRPNATRVANEQSPLDVSGILGEPRTPINKPKAHLPGTLPPITPKELHTMLTNWGKYVSDMRKSYKPSDSADKARVAKQWGVDKFKGDLSITAAAETAAPVVTTDTKTELTPETTDVPAKYLAIVSPDDPQAVMDVVAIVPKTKTVTEPATYIRKDKKWVENPQMLSDLKSATPPPVVALDGDLLNNVLQQVDGIKNGMTASIFDSDYLINFFYMSGLTAAGGFDRNRGNAERLRRYWTRGEGAAKIRWGQPGDWKRCVRHLSKYMGVRAKGYCQLRHKEALGMYTSTHAKLHKSHRNFSNDEFIMEQVWAEDTGTPTYIEDKDLLLPVEDIQAEYDDLYDSTWEPNEDVAYALEELAKCGEDEFIALIAAGGLDRNRGNAEELRQYWTHGKGAAKIRWGTPGDWKRCVRHLSKYLGPRAKGYCQLRHKDATGVYTGSRLNPGRRNSNAFGMFESDEQFENAVIQKSALIASANNAKERVGLVASSGSPYSVGSKFRIPLLIPEVMESGDGRKFKKDAIEIRDLPLPLLWQIKTGEGHMGSVVVGRIDHMERIEDGIGNAYGVFDTGPYGREAERLVKHGFIRGVSADLDQFEAKEYEPEASEKDEEISKQKLIINHARVMAATIVAKPAFQECSIYIDGEPNAQEEELIPEDGIYEESVDSFVAAEALIASGFLESEIPVTPPREWFENPGLTKATPLTVDANGRIYGHIAAWHVNHIGMPRSTRPPRSKSKYAYFHTGVVRCDNGSDVPVGQLTLAGGHASLNASASEAAKHYDDTASAIADVHAGEDDYGIWVSGSLRPGATEAQIRQLRASAPSGDWRPIAGSLELVAVCQVNVPGFPIARAMVASGKVMALVAAGAYEMAVLKSQTVQTLMTRAQTLSELSASVPDLRSRANAAKKAVRTSAITAAATKVEDMRERALVAAAVAELASIPEEERKALAEKGHALPDGSYPIRDEKDLKNAIRAYGRSNPKDRAKVRAHIRKRAKALGKVTLVPEEWKSAASMEAAQAVESMRAMIASVAEFAEDKQISEEELKKLAEAKKEADKQTEEEIKLAEDIKAGKTTAKELYDENGRTKYTPQTQPRDARGKYRKVLARLKQNLGVAGLQDALNKVQEAENLEFAGNYVDSADASAELLTMLERLDTKALNPRSLENVRSTARELGRVIANLPLPFGKEADKLRFSDLPSGLKDLIDQMISRVEAKIGKKDADIATASLKSYMSGADVYSQGEVQSEMSKLLRLLT